MNDHREPGKIFLLNGASSAGKSTLARSLQHKLHEPFLHLSFDHLRESNTLPMARIRNGELNWVLMRIDSTQPTDGNVARLITAWQARSRPTVFERMATHR